MRIRYLLPLSALFVVPWALSVSDDLASRSLPPLSTPAIHAAPDSTSAKVSSSTKEAAKPHTAPIKKAQVAAALPATLPSPTASSTPATTTPATFIRTTAPSDDFAMQVEAEVLRLSNEERVKAGLSALAAEIRLSDIARAHSADMLANDYFSHEDLQGCSSSCRVTDAGYRWRAIGENIYMMSGYRLSIGKTAAMVVDGWMNSPGHRANILGSSFVVTGIGVVTDGKSVYVTAEYANPR